jgi:hypothetical protein
VVRISLFAYRIVIYGRTKVTNSDQKLSTCFLQPFRFLHGKKAACHNIHNQKANAKHAQTQTTTQKTNINNRPTSKNTPPLKGNLFSVAYP